MKRKPTSVAEKVADLLLHPDGSSAEDESSDNEEVPKVVAFEEEYELPDQRSTEFRKRNVKLLSEQSARYRGKIVSRRELENDDEAEASSDDDDNESDNEVGEDEEETDDEAVEDEEESGDEAALSTWAAKFGNGGLAKDSDVDDNDSESEYVSNNKKNGYANKDEDDSDDNGDADKSVHDDDDVDDDDDDDDDEEDDESNANESDDDEEQSDDPSNIISATNREGELQKGVCVQNQLRIWEKLLELRIQFQKLLNKSNDLPPPTQLQQLRETDEELKDAGQECVTGTTNLLITLLNLQESLRGQFSELAGNRKRTNVHTNDSEIPTKRFATQLCDDFEQFRQYRNTVLLKWDDRTRLLTPGAGAKKKSLTETFDVIKKIDNALLNRSGLVERSQVPKLGDNTTDPQFAADINNPRLEQIRNVNIYDDSDFYHQQLRELIEHKANTSTSVSEVTRQYVELQKLRQKMKKKVDTRASKGRKIRYGVHNKLINFMAPTDTSEWTDESKDELYKSLFTS